MPQIEQKILQFMLLTPKAVKLLFLHIQLRIHGVIYGRNLRGTPCKIKNQGKIELGNNVSLNSNPDGEYYRTGLFTHFNFSVIKIGDNCLLNGTVIHSNESVIVGDNCMFGPGTVVLDNDSHNTSIDPIVRRTGKINSKPVIIGNNVWIGMHSIIMKGVQIGDNSIIAAGSIVVRKVPSNELFGGNPAVFLKKLER